MIIATVMNGQQTFLTFLSVSSCFFFTSWICVSQSLYSARGLSICSRALRSSFMSSTSSAYESFCAAYISWSIYLYLFISTDTFALRLPFSICLRRKLSINCFLAMSRLDIFFFTSDCISSSASSSGFERMGRAMNQLNNRCVLSFLNASSNSGS